MTLTKSPGVALRMTANSVRGPAGWVATSAVRVVQPCQPPVEEIGKAASTGPLDLFEARERLDGHREALRGTGRRSIVAPGGFTRASGAEAMRQLLEDDPALDAVFASDDLMAIGALRTLRRAGRRVPEDGAVVGFDDIEAAAYTAPALTSVRSPVADQAIATVPLLLGLVEGGPGEPVVVPNELVVREST
ncbi:MULTISPECIES: LacI family DNA-binding transcriptional regulator [unclassified Streptomyces]|uniref:LacI family DNA-binding transcriptional regulator n=1 Tax=unclassified Streptomyces TaxID=2593676 RepID=UPI003827E995